ncbi:MAG: tripartite tricarboxylate transporter substrate-binding protein, partial [Gemmataceae bacterium]
NLTLWRGLEAPNRTPQEAIKKLEDAARAAVNSPEFEKAGENLGFEPAFLPADKFGEVIARNDKKIADLMQQLGLKRK